MPGMNALRVMAALLILAAMPAAAQVTITGAWIRGTVPGQTSTGAFMRLRSATDTTLVAVASGFAKIAELHQSSSEGGLMRMRPVDALELPAGQVVELKPGGLHVMLLGLDDPLPVGSTVPLMLTFKSRDGARSTQSVAAEVRPLAATHSRH
jgi:copper(I)-binding protein